MISEDILIFSNGTDIIVSMTLMDREPTIDISFVTFVLSSIKGYMVNDELCTQILPIGGMIQNDDGE